MRQELRVIYRDKAPSYTFCGLTPELLTICNATRVSYLGTCRGGGINGSEAKSIHPGDWSAGDFGRFTKAGCNSQRIPLTIIFGVENWGIIDCCSTSATGRSARARLMQVQMGALRCLSPATAFALSSLYSQ